MGYTLLGTYGYRQLHAAHTHSRAHNNTNAIYFRRWLCSRYRNSSSEPGAKSTSIDGLPPPAPAEALPPGPALLVLLLLPRTFAETSPED
jgi:hypothetical protein